MTEQATARHERRSRVILRKITTIAVAAATAFTASAAMAAPKMGCYSRKEYAAEQLIRFHSELMLVGLTCKTLFPDERPFEKYHEFTVKHQHTISQAEKVLISHMSRTGAGGTRGFDTYRTDIANRASQRIGVIGSYSYCVQFLPREAEAVKLATKDLEALVEDERASSIMQLGSKPLCDVKVASMPDPVGSVAAPRAKSKPAPKAKPKAPVKVASTAR